MLRCINEYVPFHRVAYPMVKRRQQRPALLFDAPYGIHKRLGVKRPGRTSPRICFLQRDADGPTHSRRKPPLETHAGKFCLRGNLDCRAGLGILYQLTASHGSCVHDLHAGWCTRVWGGAPVAQGPCCWSTAAVHHPHALRGVPAAHPVPLTHCSLQFARQAGINDPLGSCHITCRTCRP